MVKNLFKNSQKLFERQQNSILSAAAIITAAVFLSAILGLLRNRLLVSYFFHDPAALDAYWVAFRLPDLVFQLLVIGALSAAFIPVFSKYHQENPHEAVTLANYMINLILLVFTLLAVFIFLFAYPLNTLLTGTNFSSSQIALASRFTRVMILAQFFFAASNFMTGIIQAHQRFLVPALSPIAYNLGIILGIIVFGPTLGVYGAAIGVVLGAFFHFLSQYPLARKLGFRYRLIISFSHPGVKEITRLMLPRTLALSVNQLEILIVTKIATSLPDDGLYTLVVLAQQLMSLPVRVFGMPIGQASLPFLSKESSQADLEKFTQILVRSLNQILYLALPASVGLIVLRIPAVRLAFGAKTFPWPATLLTGKMVAILSLGIFAHASVQLLSRAFYALHNTQTPLIAAIASVATNVLLSYFFVFHSPLGVLGLAVGSSAAALVHFFVLITALFFTLRYFPFQQLLLPPIKILTASVLTGFFLWAPLRLLDKFVFDTTRTLNLIVLTLVVCFIGSLVYVFLSKLFRIDQLNAYIKLFAKLGNWRQVLSSSDETIDQPSPSISQ